MAFASNERNPFHAGFLNRLIARPSFQDFANKVPVLRRLARKEGAALFEVVQGFVRSQVLFVLVELQIPERLMEGPMSPENLALNSGMTNDRMELLLRAGAGIGILKRKRDGRYGLSRMGAALVGVPGLRQMILHHRAFYRDMGDPLLLLKGEADTQLAKFWPYVFGATGDAAPEVTRTYSNLMADSQRMVARDTLAAVSLSEVRHLADIGGGSGAFLEEVAGCYPEITMTLFDLPQVIPSARERLKASGLSERIELVGGSFRTDPLPATADAVSLIRVLYDHDDASVTNLIGRVCDALPPGGRLLISEPMSGGDFPDPVTDVYFAFYTLAMRTGRTRSSREIAAICASAGFVDVRSPQPVRSYVTSVVTAVKPKDDS